MTSPIPLIRMSIPRPRGIPKPTTAPSNLVNLAPPVGAVSGNPQDFIGDMMRRIQGDIKSTRDVANVDVAGLVNRIKSQNANWRPNVQLPASQYTISRGSSGGGAVSGVKLSGSIDSWIAQAYKILGIPLTPHALASERYMIQHESGGNPRAANRTPAGIRAGGPLGLEQTIGSTFNAYKLPGYNDIFNPVHNILASLRYRKSRYKTYDIGMYKGGY